MDLNFSQQLQQQQKLVLTQEMQTSLKLLQMTAHELQDNVLQEMEENPLLEVEAGEHDENSEDSIPEESIIDYEKLVKEQSEIDYEFRENDIIRNQDDMENPLNYTADKKTLKDYLREQISDLDEEPEIIGICDYIVENIDARGYLGCSVKDIVEDLKINEKMAEDALNIVQDFQPCGVGARDLKECLKIQLRKKEISDPKVYIIVDEALELIADNKIKDIAKKLNVETKKAQEYCNMIKALEPKPSRGFFTGEVESYVIPEAYIKRIGDNLFILMNDRSIPRLTINEAYKNIIKEQQDEKALSFVKEKLNSAVALIRGIESRKKTIYNILEKIVELQRDYFIKGQHNLRPMTIADIAALLKLHESTVSRAIRDKYIGTDFGTVKIKNLFTTAISSGSSEENISSQIVKQEIGKLIENEEKHKPFSDQDIADTLSKMDIKISRRTVAKYREEMGIASSSKRKIY